MIKVSELLMAADATILRIDIDDLFFFLTFRRCDVVLIVIVKDLEYVQ